MLRRQRHDREHAIDPLVRVALPEEVRHGADEHPPRLLPVERPRQHGLVGVQDRLLRPEGRVGQARPPPLLVRPRGVAVAAAGADLFARPAARAEIRPAVAAPRPQGVPGLVGPRTLPPRQAHDFQDLAHAVTALAGAGTGVAPRGQHPSETYDQRRCCSLIHSLPSYSSICHSVPSGISTTLSVA